jgi:CRISPR/Cas system-associated exonuclease Cas4 (RecB family)
MFLLNISTILFFVMTTTATCVNYYHICHRKLWLFANGIRMEHTSDTIYDREEGEERAK